MTTKITKTTTTVKFPKRAKGQRSDKALLPMFCFAERRRLVSRAGKGKPKLIGKVRKLKTREKGFTSEGDPCFYRNLIVTLPDGTMVPAQKRSGGNYAVVQNFGLRAIPASA